MLTQPILQEQKGCFIVLGLSHPYVIPKVCWSLPEKESPDLLMGLAVHCGTICRTSSSYLYHGFPSTGTRNMSIFVSFLIFSNSFQFLA